jgi:antitoxin CptB
MTDDIEIRRRRAAYRACHRGTKEMDLVLGRFAVARLAEMTHRELDDFERLLALPDPLLTQWFHRGEEPEEAAFAALIGALRSYHGLAAVAAEGPEQA